MPFDGLMTDDRPLVKIARNDAFSLGWALAMLGITPISDAELEQHKQAEVAKHPASPMWKYRHHMNLLGLTTCGFVAALCMLNVFVWSVYCAGEQISILSTATTTVTLFVSTWFLGWLAGIRQVTGPARWVEDRQFRPLHSMPQPLLVIARQVKLAVPDAVFITGTLVQDTVPLDPYLIVERRSVTGQCERACLGIWDGDLIIAIADVA
jgi:hypothetical protein